MRATLLILVSFFLMALMSPLLQEIGVARYVPDLRLITCLYVGLVFPYERAIAYALLVGLLADGFTAGQTVGMGMIIGVVAVMLSHRMSRRLVLRGAMGTMIFTFMGSLMASVLELILAMIFVRNFFEGSSGPLIILKTMLPQALISAPFGAVLFWLYDRIVAITSQKHESVFM